MKLVCYQKQLITRFCHDLLSGIPFLKHFLIFTWQWDKSRITACFVVYRWYKVTVFLRQCHNFLLENATLSWHFLESAERWMILGQRCLKFLRLLCVCCDVTLDVVTLTSPCKRLNFITVLYFCCPPGHLGVSKVGGETRHLDASRLSQRGFFSIFFCWWWFFYDGGDDGNLTNLTPLIFSRRDIFVQEKSMWFPAATGSKEASWTVLMIMRMMFCRGILDGQPIVWVKTDGLSIFSQSTWPSTNFVLFLAHNMKLFLEILFL
jgi:hypothetical protein